MCVVYSYAGFHQPAHKVLLVVCLIALNRNQIMNLGDKYMLVKAKLLNAPKLSESNH